MLRFIVLFALVVGYIHAGPIRNKTTFKKGVTLKYDYKFQHVFADPGHSKLFAIINIEARAIFYGVEDDIVVLKLQNIAIGPTSTQLNNPNPLLRMVTQEIAPAIFNKRISIITEKLEIPIKFHHKDGVITQVLKNAKDVDESVNVKRGLMSLFEINTVGLIDTISPPPASVPLRQTLNPVYLEKTVQGLCRTKYLFPVMPLANPVMEVVKSIDTNECIVAPIVHTGLISTLRGEPCEPRVKMLETSTAVRYFIEDKQELLQVTRAIGESVYQVLLNAPTEGRIALSLNQTLEIVASDATPAPVVVAKQPTGLIAELPKHQDTPFPKGAVAQKIVAAIKTGAVDAKQVNEIILLADHIDLETIRTIWRDTKLSKGYLVVDIFAKVDSLAMRQFLRENLVLLIREYPSAISDIALFQSPDLLVMKDLLQVLETADLKIEQKQHLILNIGAYAHKLVVLSNRLNKEMLAGDELIKKAIIDMDRYYQKKADIIAVWKAAALAKKALVNDITVSLDKFTKLLQTLLPKHVVFCLKALGNMGYGPSINIALSIINDAKAPITSRILAVDALRNMPLVSIQKIMEPLITVYANAKESKVLRLKVFVLLTKFELPESTIMELLLIHQKSLPDCIGPFVYKYLSSIAKSKYWPLQKMSAKAEKVVTVLEPILPLHLKERMALPNVYENAHALWRQISSFLVWHVSLANSVSLSSAAVDLQIIPGLDVPVTTIAIRIRSSSLATQDDVGVEILIPHTVDKLLEIIRTRNWLALADATISLRRNELELRIVDRKSIGFSIPQILSLIWNVNSRRIPTASGGFLFVDQKSTVVGKLPIQKENKAIKLTSECHVNAYANGYFMHIGAGMKTAVKLDLPVTLKVRQEASKLIIAVVLTPKKAAINPVSIEQVPYTLLRQFMPEFYREGEVVVIQEVPLVICEKAVDVNYIELTEHLALRAQLPMAERNPQDIISAVWYGVHAINLYYRDEKILARTVNIALEGRMLQQAHKVILETRVEINKLILKQQTTISVLPEGNNLMARIGTIIEQNGVKHHVEGELSLPMLKPLPARCLFSGIYQNITLGMLRKVDVSQPCLIRSQVETIAPQYSRIWKRLISFGLLNIDETEHNIIAELNPEYITGGIRIPEIGQFLKQINTLKIVKAFDDAAFHPLLMVKPKVEAEAIIKILLEAHKMIIGLKPLDPSAELRFATLYHAVLYEMLAVHHITINVFTEAVKKISKLYAIETKSIDKLNIREHYIKIVQTFNKAFDPLIEGNLVTVHDKKLFQKIKEVEVLVLKKAADPALIQSMATELLTLIPKSFVPNSWITDILFLRARHLVSHSIVFKTPVTGLVMYEFLHLRQDIVMYFTLKQEFLDILPCDDKLKCSMLDLVTKEFNLFHNAASYKRVALRAFLSLDSYHGWINKLMLEFDALVNLMQIITAQLKDITDEGSLIAQPDIAVVKTWHRLTVGTEWAIKLLQEDQAIWHNINEYGVAKRADVLNALQKRVIILWNNLKIKESCVSVKPAILPAARQIQGECIVPEHMQIIAIVKLNSKILLKAHVTARKSVEQLIWDHEQGNPGFRAETTYRYLEKLGLQVGVIPVEGKAITAINGYLQKLGVRPSGMAEEWNILYNINSYKDIPVEGKAITAINGYLQKLGVRLSGMAEEWNILYNINSYKDVQVDASIYTPPPMVRDIMASPAWVKVVRFLRWPLLKYWQIEDLKLVTEVVKNEIRLPTIRIIQYLDKLMADILIIRPTVTESFMEVPMLNIPLMHLPRVSVPVPPTKAPVPTPVVPVTVAPKPVVPVSPIVPKPVVPVPVVPVPVVPVPAVDPAEEQEDDDDE